MPRLLLLLFLFCTCLSPVLAQLDTYKRQPVQHFTVNLEEVTLRFAAIDGEVNVRPNNDLTYHWYRANKVLQTQGGFDGRLLHGEYQEFYLNKNLKSKGSFVKGLRIGEWKAWYDNGQLKEIRNFKDGRLHGAFFQFDREGRLQLESRYKRGVLHGTTRSYAGGKLLSEREYRKGVEKEAKKKKTSTDEAPGKERKKVRLWVRESRKNRLEAEEVGTETAEESTEAVEQKESKEKKWKWWPFTRKADKAAKDDSKSEKSEEPKPADTP